ncbi:MULTISPECIES: hypothetical protein [unclassified Pseudoalteromonas]|uniref:hypothetical protein n=1 Tax=unclassified Pseudoalteromonas TaxID=194690 RepID=UPI000693A86A|nr:MULTISPECIES: hypothetical protein [unclassified Pseudoalteromonas]
MAWCFFNVKKSLWQQLNIGLAQDKLYVHIIKSAPSFDGIILANDCGLTTKKIYYLPHRLNSDKNGVLNISFL